MAIQTFCLGDGVLFDLQTADTLTRHYKFTQTTLPSAQLVLGYSIAHPGVYDNVSKQHGVWITYATRKELELCSFKDNAIVFEADNAPGFVGVIIKPMHSMLEDPVHSFPGCIRAVEWLNGTVIPESVSFSWLFAQKPKGAQRVQSLLSAFVSMYASINKETFLEQLKRSKDVKKWLNWVESEMMQVDEVPSQTAKATPESARKVNPVRYTNEVIVELKSGEKKARTDVMFLKSHAALKRYSQLNGADGNCLFYAITQETKGYQYAKDENFRLREIVANYYSSAAPLVFGFDDEELTHYSAYTRRTGREKYQQEQFDKDMEMETELGAIETELNDLRRLLYLALLISRWEQSEMQDANSYLVQLREQSGRQSSMTKTRGSHITGLRTQTSSLGMFLSSREKKLGKLQQKGHRPTCSPF